MPRTLAQVEDDIRRSRNAHDASTFGGRSRTDALIAEADRLRKLDTSQLGRICIDPNDDKRRADMVREALRRTGDHNMKIAAGLSSDAACAALYRMLNP